jgi:5-methylcytosine-specific restriction endonuclease McrA
MAKPADFEGFAQRLLQLLDEGRFVATYKFAVLLGLLEVVSEGVGPEGQAPASISTRDLARAVLDIYWPHTRPFEDAGTLRQNQTGQAEILRLIAEFRERTVGDATSPLSQARWAAPEDFEALVRAVEWKLIEMPLGRLQRIGDQDDSFIYELGWDEIPRQSVVKSDAFDGTLHLRPGAGKHLLRSEPLLRPLVQRSWTLTVARFNGMQEAALEEFLFGARRISLAPVAPGLRELAEGRCFYCHKPVKTQAAIDHFVPWTRHIDNGVENLVFAHAKCNADKGAYLAAEQHVERWMTRMTQPATAAGLANLASEKKWDSHPDKTQAVARSIYLALPDDYPLWSLERQFSTIQRPRLLQALAIA